MAGLGPARHRLALGLAVAEPGRQRLHRVTVGEDPVDRRLELRSAHAQGRVRGHGADEVAAGEGRLPGGEPVHAEDVHRPLHVETPRLQRTGLAVEQRLHASRRRARRSRHARAIGRRDPRWPRPRACSRGCRAWPPRARCVWSTSYAAAAASIWSDLRENSRRCASVMPTMEKQPLPSTTVEMPELAHEAVAPLRLGDGAGSGGVLVQGLAVQLAPGPVGPLHPGGHGDVGVQLRIDGDDAGGRIGHRPRGAVHELGHDQLGAHRLGGLGRPGCTAAPSRRWPGDTRRRPGLPRRGCAGWWTACARHRARRGCSRPWVRTPRRRRRRPSASASVGRGPHPCADAVPASTAAKSVSVTSPRRPERLRTGPGPASRQLAASGVVLELLLRDRLAQVAHRLLDAGELADGDHRGNPSCTGFSVGRKRLQQRLLFRNV